MKDEDHILEQIDACRPGSDDLRDAENAALAKRLADDPQARVLYDRVQKLDTRIAAALEIVEVPEGLADRLLRAMARDTASPDKLSGDEVVTATDEAAATATPEQKRRIGRREAIIASLVLAASIMLAVFISQRSPVELSTDELLVRVDEFYVNQRLEGPAHRLDKVPPPKAYPISPSVIRPSSTVWRPLTGFLGREGTAFTFATPRGAAATLFVVKLDGPRTAVRLPSRLFASPPRDPRFTAGRSTAVWQSGGLLYVLVVEGNERDYKDALVQATLA